MALKSAQTYVNLHVRDVQQSMAFFAGLGFEFDQQFAIEDRSACVVIGDNMRVMLLTEQFFKSITNKEVADTDKYAQLTLALTVESRAQVDEVVNTAASLGGRIITDPEDYRFMYQWGFQDPNGHLWAITSA